MEMRLAIRTDLGELVFLSDVSILDLQPVEILPPSKLIKVAATRDHRASISDCTLHAAPSDACTLLISNLYFDILLSKVRLN